MTKRWRPTPDELQRILDEHKMWVDMSVRGGNRADLSGADLAEAGLGNADLRNAYLTDARLYRVNLFRADLREAMLARANLQGGLLVEANMNGSILRGADFRGADLLRADLCRTDLIGANLGEADLRNSKMTKANLHLAVLAYANLEGAHLRGAELGGTVFGSTRLGKAVGLDEVDFAVPCALDLNTIELSWPLPLSFLRGCGLPDDYIGYLKDRMQNPRRYYTCVISYSAADKEFVERLHFDLQNKGVRCWFAPHDLPIGGRFRSEIDQAIRLREKLLVVLSENSIKSQWVGDEVEAALEEEEKRDSIVLFPIRLDDAVMETEEAWASTIRRSRHIGDFTSWKGYGSYAMAFDRLLNDLMAPSDLADKPEVDMKE